MVVSFIEDLVGMVSHKMSLITIFGHKHMIKNFIKKGDVLLEFSSVKWVLNEDHTIYCNLLRTLFFQNFVLVYSYFIEFFVAQMTVEI